MFTESAELYDLIYSSFKDYGAEAAQIAALLESIDPVYRTVLDVACGTGEHARLLAEIHGFTVDGLDLNPEFLRIARAKNPAGQFFEADMSDFHLPTRYDVILCLFSSIGYVKTLDRVAQTLRCFRKHLAGDGVVILEPWFPPDKMRTGHQSARAKARMYVSAASGRPKWTVACRVSGLSTPLRTGVERGRRQRFMNWASSPSTKCLRHLPQRD